MVLYKLSEDTHFVIPNCTGNVWMYIGRDYHDFQLIVYISQAVVKRIYCEN